MAFDLMKCYGVRNPEDETSRREAAELAERQRIERLAVAASAGAVRALAEAGVFDELATGDTGRDASEPDDARARDSDYLAFADQQRQEMTGVEADSYRGLILRIRWGVETRHMNDVKRFLQSKGIKYEQFKADLAAAGGVALQTRIVTGLPGGDPGLPPAA